MSHELDVVDRTVLWVQQAPRWRQAPGSRDVSSILLTSSPQVVLGNDAANSEQGRLIARLIVRTLARAMPRTSVFVDGDASLERELRGLVEDVLPAGSSGTRKAGPTVGVGSPRVADFYAGTFGWSGITSREPIALGDLNAPAALVAASLAVGEVVKAVLRDAVPQQLWGRWTAADLDSGLGACVNSFRPGLPLEAGPRLPRMLDLGEVLVVSAGALTNALLAAMLAEGRCVGRMVVWDGDRLEPSNVNRYLLVTLADALLGHSKVQFLASMATPLLQVEGVPRPYSAGHSPTRLVLVGADRLEARRAAAHDHHEFVVNGASEPTHVKVSTHNEGTAACCVGCLNQAEDPRNPPPAPTISFVSTLTSSLMLGQLYRYALGQREPWVADLAPLGIGRPHAIDGNLVPALPDCPFCRRSRVEAVG